MWGKKPDCVAFPGSASTAGGTPAGQPARRRRYLGHLRLRCTLPRQGIFKGKKSLADLNSSSPPSRSDQWHAVTASFLGWTLDAFDFFVVVFLVDTLALHFHVTKSRHRVDHDRDPGHAPGRRHRVRIARRPLRAPQASHGECGFLFRGRTAVRICSQLHRVSNPAHHLRHRHGRRVGRRSLARHGKCSAKVARDPLRNRAKRIFHRLPAGGRRGALRSARLGMARHVLGGRRAGSAGASTSASGCASRKRGNNTGPRP